MVDLCTVNFCIRKIFIQYNTHSCFVHITGGVNDLCKVNFYIRKRFIQYNTGSCFVHIAGCYIYKCVSILVPVCSECACQCVTSNQSTTKNHVVCIKPSVTKNLRYQGLTSLGPYYQAK